MVQSNPEIHGPMGIYEAYRRMYAALGVDNVDSLLQPPPDMTPKPVDAGTRKLWIIDGTTSSSLSRTKPPSTFRGTQKFVFNKIVKESPQMQALIISHCMQHLQFLASSNSSRTNARRNATTNSRDTSTNATSTRREEAKLVNKYR